MVIHGAGGAVGSTAVQLARWAGAEVIGTGRSHSRSLATEMGADRFLALDADRLEDAAGLADLVLDTIGGEVLARSPVLLRPGGTLVTIKAAAQPPASRDDIKTVVFVQESSRAQLTELARLVDQGTSAPRSRGIPARASTDAAVAEIAFATADVFAEMIAAYHKNTGLPATRALSKRIQDLTAAPRKNKTRNGNGKRPPARSRQANPRPRKPPHQKSRSARARLAKPRARHRRSGPNTKSWP